MSSDLSTDLATDLAVDLATDLAGGALLPVPGFLHWLDCANGITPNGGDAAAVLDQISGTPWAQGTPSAQPLIVASGSSPSGIGCLRFDGAAHYMTMATPAATQAKLDAQEYTMYFAARISGTLGTFMGAFDETDGLDRSRLWVNSNLRLQVDDQISNDVASSVVSTGTDYWGYGSANGATDRACQLRGGTLGTSVVDVGPVGNTHTTLAVGARVNTSVSQHAPMDLYHAFICDHELTAPEHATFQAWLDGLMGL